MVGAIAEITWRRNKKNEAGDQGSWRPVYLQHIKESSRRYSVLAGAVRIGGEVLLEMMATGESDESGWAIRFQIYCLTLTYDFFSLVGAGESNIEIELPDSP